MKSKKLLALMLSFAVIFSMFAGCAKRPSRDDDAGASATQASQTEQSGATTDKKELNTDPVQFWVGAGAKLEDFVALAEKYKAETGINVEVIEFTGLSATDKLALDGPAGNGGDVYYQGSGASSAIEQGLFMEITSEMTDLSVYTEAGLENYMYKGKLYGIPTGIESVAIIYNKDIIKEMPATWEDFIQLSLSLTDFSKDKYGFLMDVGNPYFTNFLSDAYGGYVFKNTDAGFDVSDIGINNAGAKKAFELFTGYVTKEKVFPKNMEFALMQQNFKEGKVGAILDGPWSISQYQEAGINLGVAAVPPIADAGNKPSRTYSGAYGYAISAYAKNPVGAMQFIEYIAAKPENAKVYYDRTKRSPTLIALTELDEVTKDPIQSGFSEQGKNSIPQPNVPQMGITYGPLMEAVQAVINENYDPGAALDAAAQKLKDAIEVMGE